jgi:uncharacterized protein (UPF0212 family)
MLSRLKKLEIYLNATSKDADEEYKDWQYDIDTTNIVEIVNEMEKLEAECHDYVHVERVKEFLNNFCPECGKDLRGFTSPFLK